MSNKSSQHPRESLDFDAEGSVNRHAATGTRQPRMQLLSLKEAREMLGIGDWMLFQLLRANAIRSVKIGGRRLISMHAVEDYVAQLEAESEVRGNYG